MESQKRSVRARSAWLLAVMAAMFAAMISLPTPAAAQPRPNIAPCERVLFAAFYAASVEGIPQSGLTACLAGATQPTNRVFRSWSDAPTLLRHMEHIDARLIPGVTRDSLPSPGEVALANYDALIARCELVEETPDAGEDADADGGASRHRSRVRLSRSAMRNHAWDPFAWFPSRCARRLSIEIRPAEAVMVSRIVRNDAFVVDATRRLADPTRDLSSIPTLVTGLQSRLADTGRDPIPAPLFPPLANACLATIAALPTACFTAGASEGHIIDADTVRELARLRAENHRLTGENRGFRASPHKNFSQNPALWFVALALGATLALAILGISEQIKRARPTPTVENGDEDQESIARAIDAAVTAAVEKTRRHYEVEVIPALLRKREEEECRHFETMITRHRGELAEEVGKRRAVEGERDRSLTALRLLEKSVASHADAEAKLLSRLAKFASDCIMEDDDPRREILRASERATTAEEMGAYAQTAFDVMTQWRRRIEAFDQAPGDDPNHRDTRSMLGPTSPAAEADPPGSTTLRDFPAVSPPPAEPPKS